MKIEALGDRAVLLRELENPASWIEPLRELHLPGLLDLWAARNTLAIEFESPAHARQFRTHPPNISPQSGPNSSRHHIIPVHYHRGPDLLIAAEQRQLTPAQFIELHANRPYSCFAVGFCPGFAYLGPLKTEIQGLPRLSQPRTRVEPGMVGITGNQTAVYPLERPGGWWLIGQTPLTLVDVTDEYFPIQAGDQVEFVPIDSETFDRMQGQRLE